jgi:hypothetical protein
MATIGMCNLNDSDGAGPLTSADLRPHLPPSEAPRIPRQRRPSGCGLAGLLLMAVSAVAVACGLGALWEALR